MKMKSIYHILPEFKRGLLMNFYSLLTKKRLKTISKKPNSFDLNVGFWENLWQPPLDNNPFGANVYLL